MKKYAKIKCVFLLGLLGAAVSLGFGGCSTSGTGTRSAIKGDLGKVAIVPFENLSSEPNAGLIMMSNITSAFTKYTDIELLAQDIIRDRMIANEGEYIAPRKIGEYLGVDTVITGAVTEFRYVYGAGEQPVVGLNLQIINVETGEVFWSEAATSSGNLSWIREESLAGVAEAISISLAKDFKRVYAPVKNMNGYTAHE